MSFDLAAGTTVLVEPPDLPALQVAPPAITVLVEHPVSAPVQVTPFVPARLELAAPASSTPVLIVPGPPGPPGPPGGGGNAGRVQFTAIAATDLSGHRVVTPLPNDTVGYADYTTPAHLHAPLWITLNAALAGADVDVVAYGAITEPSWTWTVGPLYLGAVGALVQILPAAPAFLAPLGFASSANDVFIDRSPSITLV